MEPRFEFFININKGDQENVAGYDMTNEQHLKWFPHVFSLWQAYRVLPRIGEKLWINRDMVPADQFEKWLVDEEGNTQLDVGGFIVNDIIRDYMEGTPRIIFWLIK